MGHIWVGKLQRIQGHMSKDMRGPMLANQPSQTTAPNGVCLYDLSNPTHGRFLAHFFDRLVNIQAHPNWHVPPTWWVRGQVKEPEVVLEAVRQEKWRSMSFTRGSFLNWGSPK